MWNSKRAPTRSTRAALAGALLLGLCQSCTHLSKESTGYRPGRSDSFQQMRADAAFEIASLGKELVDRAEARVPLGGLRVAIGDFEAVPSARPAFRQATLVERDWRATEATVKYELEMSLSQRLNVLTASAVRSVSGLDATHILEATFQRTAGDLDLSLRLVELESGWIVSTARRRIRDFVPDRHDLKGPVQAGREPSMDMRDTRSTRESRVGEQRFPVGPTIASAEEAVRRGRAPAFPSQEPLGSEPETVAPFDAPGAPLAGASDQLPEPYEVLTTGPELPAEPILFEDGPAARRLERLGGPGRSMPRRVVQ